MPATTLTDRESRERWSQLQALICEWGLIGVADQPHDEFDCLVGPLLTMLQSGATDDAIATQLRQQFVDHIGLSPVPCDFLVVAQRARTWFDVAWREVAEPATIFVALLDEGTSVWRPVQARPLGTGLFRIVGVDADVSDERWQFEVGAVVRCEERRFGDGKTGVTAVDRVAFQPPGC